MKNKDFLNIRLELWICLFFVIAILAVYWQVRDFEFVAYDDDVYVAENSHVKKGLTLENIKWAFTTGEAANWHPLTWLSHILDVQLYGIDSGRHHLTNVLFHIANTLLLFLVFRKMTNNLWQSSLLAALFAFHPLHAESVAQVAERKDVLSTFFWLLTMWSYAQYAESPRFDKYLLVMLFFIMGLMSKPMLVTLPCVLLLLDFYPLGRIQELGVRSQKLAASSQQPAASSQLPITKRQLLRANSTLILEKIPLLILAAASSVITFFVQQSGGAVRSLEIYPLHIRIANALLSYVAYLGKMIYPVNLAFLYLYRKTFPEWQVAGACIFLALIFFLAIRTIKTHPYISVGWLWYVGTLVPVIGLVQVGSQAMADRYTYIPLIGIFIIISWGIPDLFAKWREKKLSIIILPLLLFLMIMTYKQAGYWKNSITLFEHAIAVTTDNYIAHINLGTVLQKQGKLDEAIAHYSEVLRIKPNYAKGYNNMGTVLEDQGKLDEAIAHYSEALRLNPKLIKAHCNLGVVFEKKGNVEKAIQHYLDALRVNPNYSDAHHNLGNIMYRKGKIKEAIDHFQAVLRIKPDDSDAYNNLGVIFFETENVEAAIFHFQKALSINPKDYTAYHNLKKIYALQEKKDESPGKDQGK